MEERSFLYFRSGNNGSSREQRICTIRSAICFNRFLHHGLSHIQSYHYVSSYSNPDFGKSLFADKILIKLQSFINSPSTSFHSHLSLCYLFPSASSCIKKIPAKSTNEIWSYSKRKNSVRFKETKKI